MQFNRRNMRSIFATAAAGCAAILLASCSDLEPVAPEPESPVPPASSFDSSVPRAWFDLALTLTRTTPGFTPPVASRAFGWAGVALYEAVVPGIPGHRSLGGLVNGLTALPHPPEGAHIHWPSAANAALAHMMRSLYANTSAANQDAINALEAQIAATQQGAAGAAAHEAGAAWGESIADAVFAASVTDGGHEGYLRNFPASYVSPVGPGTWVPTSAQLIPMQPYWGSVRPFCLPAGNPNIACDPGPHPAYSTDSGSDFYAEALEVQTVGDALTAEQQAIANFWADGAATITPPGHSISITTQVLEAEGSTLDEAAHAYALVGMAVADAFIACWKSKYEFNLLRPITYIRNVIGDATWTSYIGTPPFPEYTSGHSTQSGAVAAVLTELFGEDYAFTDETHVAATPSYPARSYASFDEAADEAAISRLYGGIHYRAAIENGLTQGRKIGAAVLSLPLHIGGH